MIGIHLGLTSLYKTKSNRKTNSIKDMLTMRERK